MKSVWTKLFLGVQGSWVCTVVLLVMLSALPVLAQVDGEVTDVEPPQEEVAQPEMVEPETAEQPAPQPEAVEQPAPDMETAQPDQAEVAEPEVVQPEFVQPEIVLPPAPILQREAEEQEAAQPEREEAEAPERAEDVEAPMVPLPPVDPMRPTRAEGRIVNGIILNFENASLDAVLDYLSEAAGFIVVKEVPTDGRVNVVSRQPLTAGEAVSLLNSVLNSHGLAAVQQDRILKILPRDRARRSSIPVQFGNDPARIALSDELITQVIPIRYVDATRLQRDLTAFFPAGADVSSNASSNAIILTDTSANIRRIVEIVRALDTHTAGGAEVRVFRLMYANAGSAARLINELFRQEDPASQLPGQLQQMQRFMRAQQQQRGGSDSEEGDSARTVRVTASADDRTNTVVVSGPPDVLEVVERVLDELDSDPATEQAVFIYSLRNARARNIEGVVNSLFGAGVRTTGTGTTQQQQRGTQQQQQRGTQQQQQQQQRQQTPFGQGGGGQFGGTFGQLAQQQQQQTLQQQRGTAAATAAQQRLSPQAAGAASDLFGQVYVVADEDTNSLLVATGSRHFDRVREVLEELDRAVPQVLIKVLIAEVTHSDGLDLGVEFSVLNRQAFGGEFSQIGTEFGVGAATGGAVYRLTRDDVTAAVRALATVGKLDVLSRPYILTSDNQPARILVGQQVPIPTNTRTTETGQTISNIVYRDAGIILEVTPHINPDGLVIMDVAPSISALTESTVQIAPGFNAPVFNERSAFSRVAIQDGETIVIGGLMEDRLTQNISKVPLLGDIPVLRHLFRRSISTKSKTELLIFLTPHVAVAPESLREMSDGERDNARIVPHAVEPGAFEDQMRSMERLGGRDDGNEEGRMTNDE